MSLHRDEIDGPGQSFCVCVDEPLGAVRDEPLEAIQVTSEENELWSALVDDCSVEKGLERNPLWRRYRD